MQTQQPIQEGGAIPLPPSSVLTPPVPKADLILTPDAALAQPLLILSAAMLEAYDRALARGAALEVNSPQTFAEAAEYLNNLTKFKTSINKYLSAAKAPATAHLERIKAQGDELIDPLEKYKVEINTKMSAYKTKVDRERAEAIEAQRKQVEQEQRARAAAQAASAPAPQPVEARAAESAPSAPSPVEARAPEPAPETPAPAAS